MTGRKQCACKRKKITKEFNAAATGLKTMLAVIKVVDNDIAERLNSGVLPSKKDVFYRKNDEHPSFYSLWSPTP